MDDDPAGGGHSADRLSLAGAGAGAAGVDRRFLFRLDEPHCPGGPMGRSAPGDSGHDRPLDRPAAIRLPGLHDDPYLHHRRSFRRGDRLLPVPDRPLPRGTRARPGAAGRVGRGPGANGARPDGQRDDDDPGAGSDDLRRLRQVPFRRSDDCHLAGRGPVGLHDRGPGLAAGLWPRGLLAVRRRRQGGGQGRCRVPARGGRLRGA